MSRSDVLKGLVKGLNFLSSCEPPIGAAQQRMALCRFSLPSFVVHRGISPESILVCKDRGKMTTKISDFDLGKRIRFPERPGYWNNFDWMLPGEEATVQIIVLTSSQ